MNSSGKKDNIITGLVIVLSILGIVYFGYNAIRKNTIVKTENPYRYPIEKYETKKDQESRYIESAPLNVQLIDIAAIAIDSKNQLFIAGSGKVLIYNPDNSPGPKFKYNGTATAIFSLNNKIFLGMTDHVQVFSIEGKLISKWDQIDKNTHITSIAATKKSVFVADAENRVVWEYSYKGKKIRPIGRKDKNKEIPGYVIPSYYFDLSIDPDGFLWVVNPGRHSLENYTPEATVRTSWGKYSSKMEGFCGCCNPIHIAIRQDGFFITAEKGIARIKVYNRLGDLVDVVAGPDKFIEGTKIRDLAVNSLGHIFIPDPPKKSIRIFIEKKDKMGGLR